MGGMSGSEPHDLLSDVVFRRFVEDDLEALYQFSTETPELASELGDDGMATLREQLGWPGHQPERDRWLAVARTTPERLLGYSSVFRSPDTPRADLLVATHPTRRRQGIGAELLRRAVADAQALGASDAAIYVNDQHVEASTFVRRRGFEPVAAYTELMASAETHFPQAQWPAGFTARAWRDDSDLPILTEAANRGYAGLWGHNHASEEEWAEWLPMMDTHGFFLLFGPDGVVVGIARARMRTAAGRLVGVVDAPGVVAERRDDELYRPLLLCALDWLVAQNPAEYRIESWGDDPMTLDGYRALGFTTARREILYRLALAPQPLA